MLLPGSEEWPETEVEPQWPALHMPEPKPCLAADAQLSGDRAFGRSQGFSPDQIKGAVAAFQEQTLRCYEGHEDAEGDLRLHFVVGCDGIVRSSSLAEDQSNDPDFAACVARVFGHAPFPAHARDTVEFQVPLSFVADTSGD